MEKSRHRLSAPRPGSKLDSCFAVSKAGQSLGLPHSRPMPSIGAGCHELRVVDARLNWRIMYYIAPDAVVILDVFHKQTATTPKSVIVGCKGRLAEYHRLTAMKKDRRHAQR